MTVSYTHLDVYKRQVQKLTEFYEEGYDCARNLFEFEVNNVNQQLNQNRAEMS